MVTCVALGAGMGYVFKVTVALTSQKRDTFHISTYSVFISLTRCTGYRPILDACKSFAGDVDVEDLGLCTFRKDLSSPLELPPYDPKNDPQFPDFLRQEEGLFNGKGETSLWCSAGSLEDLYSLTAEHKGKEIKLVVGNTSRGYYKDERPEVRGSRRLHQLSPTD